MREYLKREFTLFYKTKSLMIISLLKPILVLFGLWISLTERGLDVMTVPSQLFYALDKYLITLLTITLSLEIIIFAGCEYHYKTVLTKQTLSRWCDVLKAKILIILIDLLILMVVAIILSALLMPTISLSVRIVEIVALTIYLFYFGIIILLVIEIFQNELAAIIFAGGTILLGKTIFFGKYMPKPHFSTVLFYLEHLLSNVDYYRDFVTARMWLKEFLYFIILIGLFITAYSIKRRIRNL